MPKPSRGVGGETKIEWTHQSGYRGATWNPTRGCRKLSDGCKHCYAETFAERWRGVAGHPYELGFEPRLVPEKIDIPLRTKAPTCWFVNSMSDLFLEDFTDEYIAAVYGVMAAAMDHRFLVLTKRAARMQRWFEWLGERGGLGPYLRSEEAHELVRPHVSNEHTSRFETYRGKTLRSSKDAWAMVLNAAAVVGKGPLEWVWHGVSVESQKTADERIPRLLETPAAVRFVSYEPALGPVDFESIEWPDKGGHRVDVLRRGYWSEEGYRGLGPSAALGAKRGGFTNHSDMNGIDWLIVGGESGSGARPFSLEWARSTVEQCRAAGVPVFVKQMGARPRNGGDGPYQDAVAIRDRKGGDMSEWPEDLRVREYPKVAGAKS